MNIANIKKVNGFCNSLVSKPNWRDVVKCIVLNDNDFEIDNVRFIHKDAIQDILEDELAGDEYILGSFNAWVIAEATDWPLALIEAAQKGGQYEAIGEAMTGEHVAELARIYVQQDGYGHHFNHYDGDEVTLAIEDKLFYVFDNR